MNNANIFYPHNFILGLCNLHISFTDLYDKQDCVLNKKSIVHFAEICKVEGDSVRGSAKQGCKKRFQVKYTLLVR
jgi:DNA gyrase/topoisomerase IV subunit B